MDARTLKNIHTLLLPVTSQAYFDLKEDLDREFSSRNISAVDAAPSIELALLHWRQGSPASPLLSDITKTLLSSNQAFVGTLAGDYFKAHQKLQESGNLSLDEASALLSHADMIADLLINDQMSCAQVASVLSARRSRHVYTWQQIQLVARFIEAVPSLEYAQLNETLLADVENNEHLLTDATSVESIQILSEQAASLGYPSPIEKDLIAFYNEGAFSPAYSIILHYNLVITNYFDHPVTAAYEFSPRGVAILQTLQKEYHRSYTATENAYLNNSKGVSTFDSNWAWGKKATHRGRALALASILDGLNQMAYTARKELSIWLRAWLIRLENEWRDENRIHIPETKSDQIVRFLRNVAQNNTSSRGILEQRVVDFIAVQETLELPYSSKGIGESVSASNTASKKAGDVEILYPSERHIHAYEAHGGVLTPAYVESHAATLANILSRRSPELEMLGKRHQWRVTIEFLAHELRGLDVFDPPQELSGYPICWKFRSFKEAVDSISEDPLTQDSTTHFNELVTNRIGSTMVAPEIKERFLELLN